MVVVQQNVMLVNVSPVEAQTEALEADTHTHTELEPPTASAGPDTTHLGKTGAQRLQ